MYRAYLETPSTAQLFPFEAGGAFAGVAASRFEIVSRGDFVPGVLYSPPNRPPGSGPVPLLLVQHGLGGSKTSPYLDCAARWVHDGWAVASIDLPLHGARSSPKLSERLIQGIDHVVNGEQLDAETFALVEEFTRQSTSDLIRTIDAMTALDPVDPHRVGYLGFGLGAVVGTYLLAHDSRPKVAVLAFAGGGQGPPELDPSTYVGRGEVRQATDRQLLIVAAENDKRVSIASSRSLFDAAREPKEFLISPGDHEQLTGKSLTKVHDFLKNAID